MYHLLVIGLQCVQEDAQPMQETDLGEIVESGGCCFFFSEMLYNFQESVCITEYCKYSNEMKQKKTFRLCASFL
jgi:hypothetical protein